MDDAEHNQTPNDVDVEVTDIPLQRNDESGNGVQPHSPFALRYTRRQPTLQLTVTISIVVLTLLVFLGSSASVRNIVTLGIFGPTSTPTQSLPRGADLFYISTVPAWGYVAIDGRSLARLPIAPTDAPLRLARGRHHIVWHAEPFQARSCFVSVPIRPDSDTCLVNTTTRLEEGIDVWVIRFFMSLDTLPTNERMALISRAQAALNSLQATEMVQPGEQYVDVRSQSHIVTATQPLKATLHFDLDTNPNSNKSCVSLRISESCLLQGQDCRSFCDTEQGIQAFAEGDISEQQWDVLAVIGITWDYTTLDGKVVAKNQPDTGVGDTSEEYIVEFQIHWSKQGWQVMLAPGGSASPFAGDPACASAVDDIALNGFYGQTGGDVEEAVSWSFVANSNKAEGCLAVGTPGSDPLITPSPPRLPAAYLMHRFGVVLTANDAAEHYFGSGVSRANAYEQKIAKQLATLIHT